MPKSTNLSPSASRALIAAAGLALLAGPARAESFCDPNLLGEVKSPQDYQPREGRCEGLYAQQVSAVSLDVRSLVASFGPFDPAKDPELALAWSPPPGAGKDVRLRAFSFQPRTYYRMDTAVPAGHGSYRWPADVLGGLRLVREDIGVVAWTELPGPGGGSREVYLPLRAGRGTGAASEEGHQVSLVPSERLRQVHVRISRLDAGGDVTAVLRDNQELGYGYYPSNTPTDFFTGRLGEAGFYRVEVTATPVSGLPVKQDFELYHPGD